MERWVKKYFLEKSLIADNKINPNNDQFKMFTVPKYMQICQNAELNVFWVSLLNLMIITKFNKLY